MAIIERRYDRKKVKSGKRKGWAVLELEIPTAIADQWDSIARSRGLSRKQALSVLSDAVTAFVREQYGIPEEEREVSNGGKWTDGRWVPR